MNKRVAIVASVLVGVMMGLTVGQWWFEDELGLNGVYHSNSAFVTHTPKGQPVYEALNITLEFSAQARYEALVALADNIGFVSIGDYEYLDHHLSLRPSSHDKVLPDKTLSFRENFLVSKGVLLVGENLEVAAIDKEQFLLIRPHHILYFCARTRCGQVPLTDSP